MESKESVKQFSKYSLIMFVFSILLFLVSYLLAAFVLYPIVGSIGGKTFLGYILLLFIIILPSGLFIGSILTSLSNFIKNDPQDHYLSFSYLFFILSIITTSLSIISLWLHGRPPNPFQFIIRIWFPLGYIIAILFSVIFIIYTIKAKKNLIAWNRQLNVNLVFSIIFFLINIISFAMFFMPIQ